MGIDEPKKPFPPFPDDRPGPWRWAVAAKRWIHWRQLYSKEELEILDNKTEKENEDLDKQG
jgi:hypothetical protein